MGAVAYPVHGAQRGVVKRRFTQVVFQYDTGARDARGFAQELRDIGSMMEHINEEANVERLIGKRELRAIERSAWDVASWARNDFHPFDDEVRPVLREQAGNCAVAATDIEDSASFSRNQGRQGIAKYTRPAAEDEGPVAAGYPRERPGRRRGSHRIGGTCKFLHIS